MPIKPTDLILVHRDGTDYQAEVGPLLTGVTAPTVLAPTSESKPDACALEFVGSKPQGPCCGAWKEAIWKVTTDDFQTVMEDRKPILDPDTTQHLESTERVNIKIDPGVTYKVRLSYSINTSEDYEADIVSQPSEPVEFTSSYIPGWFSLKAPEQAMWRDLAYGNDVWVACAQDKADVTLASRMMYSYDGISWELAPNIPDDGEWQTVCFGDGKFVCLGRKSSQKCLVSEDGINWTRHTTPAGGEAWCDITYGGDKFVAVAYNNNDNPSSIQRAMYSVDGYTWIKVNAPLASKWFSVTYGNGRFVSCSQEKGHVMYSDDGIDWKLTTAAEPNQWLSVTHGVGRFVAVAQSGDNRVMYSDDGISWLPTQSIPPDNGWTGVTYGCDKFVAVARDGDMHGEVGDDDHHIMHSRDGITWEWDNGSEGQKENYWENVKYGDGKFVAVGQSGENRIMYSFTGTDVRASKWYYDENDQEPVTNRTIQRTFGLDPEENDLSHIGIAELTEQPEGEVLAYVPVRGKWKPIPDQNKRIQKLEQEVIEANAEILRSLKKRLDKVEKKGD
jgi:hypothetical protein